MMPGAVAGVRASFGDPSGLTVGFQPATHDAQGRDAAARAADQLYALSVTAAAGGGGGGGGAGAGDSTAGVPPPLRTNASPPRTAAISTLAPHSPTCAAWPVEAAAGAAGGVGSALHVNTLAPVQRPASERPTVMLPAQPQRPRMSPSPSQPGKGRVTVPPLRLKAIPKEGGNSPSNSTSALHNRNHSHKHNKAPHRGRNPAGTIAPLAPRRRESPTRVQMRLTSLRVQALGGGGGGEAGGNSDKLTTTTGGAGVPPGLPSSSSPSPPLLLQHQRHRASARALLESQQQLGITPLPDMEVAQAGAAQLNAAGAAGAAGAAAVSQRDGLRPSALLVHSPNPGVVPVPLTSPARPVLHNRAFGPADGLERPAAVRVKDSTGASPQPPTLTPGPVATSEPSEALSKLLSRGAIDTPPNRVTPSPQSRLEQATPSPIHRHAPPKQPKQQQQQQQQQQDLPSASQHLSGRQRAASTASPNSGASPGVASTSPKRRVRPGTLRLHKDGSHEPGSSWRAQPAGASAVVYTPTISPPRVFRPFADSTTPFSTPPLHHHTHSHNYNHNQQRSSSRSSSSSRTATSMLTRKLSSNSLRGHQLTVLPSPTGARSFIGHAAAGAAATTSTTTPTPSTLAVDATAATTTSLRQRGTPSGPWYLAGDQVTHTGPGGSTTAIASSGSSSGSSGSQGPATQTAPRRSASPSTASIGGSSVASARSQARVRRRPAALHLGRASPSTSPAPSPQRIADLQLIGHAGVTGYTLSGASSPEPTNTIPTPRWSPSSSTAGRLSRKPSERKLQLRQSLSGRSLLSVSSSPTASPKGTLRRRSRRFGSGSTGPRSARRGASSRGPSRGPSVFRFEDTTMQPMAGASAAALGPLASTRQLFARYQASPEPAVSAVLAQDHLPPAMHGGGPGRATGASDGEATATSAGLKRSATVAALPRLRLRLAVDMRNATMADDESPGRAWRRPGAAVAGPDPSRIDGFGGGFSGSGGGLDTGGILAPRGVELRQRANLRRLLSSITVAGAPRVMQQSQSAAQLQPRRGNHRRPKHRHDPTNSDSQQTATSPAHANHSPSARLQPVDRRVQHQHQHQHQQGQRRHHQPANGAGGGDWQAEPWPVQQSRDHHNATLLGAGDGDADGGGVASWATASAKTGGVIVGMPRHGATGVAAGDSPVLLSTTAAASDGVGLQISPVKAAHH